MLLWLPCFPVWQRKGPTENEKRKCSARLTVVQPFITRSLTAPTINTYCTRYTARATAAAQGCEQAVTATPVGHKTEVVTNVAQHRYFLLTNVCWCLDALYHTVPPLSMPIPATKCMENRPQPSAYQSMLRAQPKDKFMEQTATCR